MRLSCQAADLGKAAASALNAVSPRTTNPLLEGLLLEARGDTLAVTGSDGAMAVVARIEASVEAEGRVVVPGRLFADVIRRMPEGSVAMSLNERNALSLKCLNSKTSVAGMDAAFYPERAPSDGERFISLPQPLVKDMIRQTSFALSSDDSRRILTGEYMQVVGGELRLVALDGFQMAIRSHPLSAECGDMGAVIPGRFAGNLARLMGDGEDDMARFAFGGKSLTVEAGNVTAQTSLLEGEYIKYETILPAEWNTRLVVDKPKLEDCVSRASLMAKQAKNNIIKIDISGGEMTITSEAEAGDFSEALNVEHEGDDLLIGFNVDYVADALRAIEDDAIEMRFISPIRPCVVRPVEGGAFTYVLLPLRMGNG